MHELSIADNVIRIVQEQLKQHPSSRVKAVYLQVGVMSNVLVDSLLFGFETLIQDTDLCGAQLIVREIPVTVRCRACRHESPIDQFHFQCRQCAGDDVEVISGDELFIESIEIEDKADYEHIDH